MITGAPTSPMVTRGRSFAKPLPANLKFAAGDGGGRSHLRDLGLMVGRFPESHI